MLDIRSKATNVGLDHVTLILSEFARELKELYRFFEGDGFNVLILTKTTFYFYFPINLDAEYEVVAGDFNAWNADELRMQKTDTGWVLPYVLAPGNYEYRFRVAGQSEWKNDPLNSLRVGRNR